MVSQRWLKLKIYQLLKQSLSQGDRYKIWWLALIQLSDRWISIEDQLAAGFYSNRQLNKKAKDRTNFWLVPIMQFIGIRGFYEENSYLSSLTRLEKPWHRKIIFVFYLLEYLLMCDEISVKKVIDAAIEMFGGDSKKAVSFLYKPAILLDGKTPISLLDTPAGAARVLDLIVRLQSGMISWVKPPKFRWKLFLMQLEKCFAVMMFSRLRSDDADQAWNHDLICS